jgi:FKBP-type peptidyl-prolyl cis-trans isomerase FkpA
MIRSVLTIIFAALVLVSCKKNNDSGCSPVDPASEAGQMAAFCNANGIMYTVDSNGIYYQIIDQGAGSTPNLNSVVTVTYTTSTLDGTLIEDKSTTPVTVPLNQFIEGWRIAIPYLQKGGHMKMVVPSALAYGCTGIAGIIPPNTPLYFDIVLVDVQ